MSQTKEPRSGQAGGQVPAADAQRQQAAAAEVEVPERPKLAAEVELSGEMQESGFENQQWLVQRQGRFIQLTELLYRVAEQADGERTHEEMAAGASEALGRKVSADNVRQLVKKLIPMGLIVKADGTVAEAPGGAGGGRSPLAVNMRMAMIDPKLVDRIARVFQPLFLPLVLILLLLVAAAAQAWLFLVHGVAGGMHDALYSPGLLLAVLGTIIVSTAFHEFGHAAALRYGGGKVRGMGAGLYIIYPAFYTDVTDNYRLGRWGKVRTDLGGFYFNLIFAVGLMALYAVTGWQFLLVVVVMINLEIIHQCLPFVRLDGYWTLADMTGIPDFFSQIGPFLRTVLPLPFWQGRKLPNLKGWVKAVFALYILITIPLLAFLLFTMVRTLPRVLATSWDSFLQQKAGFVAAQGSGEVLGMVASAVQMLLLAIPTIGTFYVLFSLGRTVVRTIWNWSKPTPGRRAIGGLGTLALVGLLAFLWAPSLPFRGDDRPGPLYAQARRDFVPIRPDERGTIGEAAVAALGVPAAAVQNTPLERFVPAPLAVPTAIPTTVPAGLPATAPTTGPTAPAGAPTVAPTTAVGVTPSAAATSAVGVTPTAVSTGTPTAPTSVPTIAPTALPTGAPGLTPTALPAGLPTATSSAMPTPTVVPTTVPTVAPTFEPTIVLTRVPTVAPALEPTVAPTPAPATLPTVAPTAIPTTVPAPTPSAVPDRPPAPASPTAPLRPTTAPNASPTTTRVSPP